MKRYLKVFCISSVCLLTLFGCSNKQDKLERTDSEQLKKSETSNKTEENTTQNNTEEQIDLSNTFNGINGCAVLYSPSENRYSIYNKSMAEQEVSPFSTFKIISTLIGLHNDIIEDETSIMNYNGTEYPNAEWNGDLTLQEAFQTSCIWYFRQIIDAAGKDETEKELKELSYGNSDVSEWNGSNINSYEDLNGFWLNSSLKISPLEQVEVLSEIFGGKSIYSSEDIEILKKVMLIQHTETQQIYGKTGSGSNGEAWFTGFADTQGKREYFAIYLSDNSQKSEISGNVAKGIAVEVIQSFLK